MSVFYLFVKLDSYGCQYYKGLFINIYFKLQEAANTANKTIIEKAQNFRHFKDPYSRAKLTIMDMLENLNVCG